LSSGEAASEVLFVELARLKRPLEAAKGQHVKDMKRHERSISSGSGRRPSASDGIVCNLFPAPPIWPAAFRPASLAARKLARLPLVRPNWLPAGPDAGRCAASGTSRGFLLDARLKFAKLAQFAKLADLLAESLRARLPSCSLEAPANWPPPQTLWRGRHSSGRSP